MSLDEDTQHLVDEGILAAQPEPSDTPQVRLAEVLFEQPLMVLRVVKTTKDEYDIEVAMFNGPSIGVTEPNEFIAKTINSGLLKGYQAELKAVQERMRDALSNLQSEPSGE